MYRMVFSKTFLVSPGSPNTKHILMRIPYFFNVSINFLFFATSGAGLFESFRTLSFSTLSMPSANSRQPLSWASLIISSEPAGIVWPLHLMFDLPMASKYSRHRLMFGGMQTSSFMLIASILYRSFKYSISAVI